MKKTCLIMVVVVVSLASLVGAQETSIPEELSHLDPAWVEEYLYQVDEYREMFAAAYDFDETMRWSFRQELIRRITEQFYYERELMPDLTNAADADPAAFPQKMDEFINGMPFHYGKITEWVDQQVPAKVTEDGRVRLAELMHRQGQLKRVEEQDLERLAGARAKTIHNRKSRIAPVSSGAKPMPHGAKAEAAVEKERRKAARRFVHPRGGPADPSATWSPIGSSPERKLKERGKARTRRKKQAEAVGAASPGDKVSKARKPGVAIGSGRKAKSRAGLAQPRVKATPAPPLDEWDRYVASVAEKYGFATDQVTKAQSILRDLRRRAYQYQMSRSGEFAHVELMADDKARKARLEGLKAPLDALFAELKVRLEGLPTLEQQQRAETPKKSRK